MLCCGDITSLETIDFILKNYPGFFYLSLGNVDSFAEEDTEDLSGLKNLGRTGGIIKLGGKRIGLCHEPDLMDEIIEQGDCDIIFYGHTHKPWIEKQDDLRLVNPGTLAGMFAKATFAVWDTDKDEPDLKILEEM